MAESVTIRIDSDIKLVLEYLRDNQLRCKTHSDAIERLATYYKKNEELKTENFENQRIEKMERDETMIHLGKDLKQKVIEFGRIIKLRSESSIIEFLLDHFNSSPTISRETFETYIQLKG